MESAILGPAIGLALVAASEFMKLLKLELPRCGSNQKYYHTPQPVDTLSNAKEVEDKKIELS
jgi:hypothetical protein